MKEYLLDIQETLESCHLLREALEEDLLLLQSLDEYDPDLMDHYSTEPDFECTPDELTSSL